MFNPQNLPQIFQIRIQKISISTQKNQSIEDEIHKNHEFYKAKNNENKD